MAEALALLDDRVKQATAEQLATSLVGQMAKAKDSSSLIALASALAHVTDKIRPATTAAAATKLVERIAADMQLRRLIRPNPANPVSMYTVSLPDLASALRSLKDKATIKAGAIVLMEQMAQETDAGSFRGLASALASLMDVLGQPTAEQVASKLMERMAKEKDPDMLHALAFGLRSLPQLSLTQKELAQASGAFDIPDAPCGVLLQFESNLRRSELAHQLANPLCQEEDWKLLALDAAQLTGRPLARRGKKSANLYEALNRRELSAEKPEEIIVDFPQLSAYVSSQRTWRERFSIGISMFASLILLLGALMSFVTALAQTLRRPSVAYSPYKIESRPA